MLLTWDLSTFAGWAVMTSAAELLARGTKQLPKVDDKMDFGTRQLALFYEFNRLCERYPGISAVGYESPLTPINANDEQGWSHRSKDKTRRKFQTTPYTIRFQHVLAATIELAARLRGLPVEEVAGISAKAALAHSKASKLDMIEAAKKLYSLDELTEHEADAIGVALVIFKQRKRLRAETRQASIF